MIFFCFEDSDYFLVGEFGKGIEVLVLLVFIFVGVGECGEGGFGFEFFSVGIWFFKGMIFSGLLRLIFFVIIDCIYVY